MSRTIYIPAESRVIVVQRQDTSDERTASAVERF
jgi:hypothetical protein